MHVSVDSAIVGYVSRPGRFFNTFCGSGDSRQLYARITFCNHVSYIAGKGGGSVPQLSRGFISLTGFVSANQHEQFSAQTHKTFF